MSDLLKIYQILYQEYGTVKCFLHHQTAFQLLCAVVLSAQCKDERVNAVTADLFAAFPDPVAMNNAEIGEIELILRPIGLFRAKSAYIKRFAKMIVEDFGGKVPEDMNNLLKLPGVGRKSANVILGNAFNLPGFPADTHVQRVLTRLGIIAVRCPLTAERTVTAALPPQYWCNFSHLLILHGRNVCHPRKPDCANCKLYSYCARQIKPANKKEK